MDGIVYDHDKLKVAIDLLLDLKFGKARSDVVRSNLTGAAKTLNWFWGPRLPLKYCLEVAEQPGGRLWMLDLLDKVDRKRDTIAKEREASIGPRAKAAQETLRNSVRKNRLRETAAILTERIRRISRGEPPLTKDDEKEFLSRRRAYWKRRTVEFLEAAKQTTDMEKFGSGGLQAKIADILLNEELAKYKQAKAGIYNLSSSSQRRLNNNPRDKKMRERVETAMAAAFKASQQ